MRAITSIITLTLLSTGLAAAEELMAPEDFVKLVPERLEHRVIEGDFNGDGLKDAAIQAYDASVIIRKAIILLQREGGAYELVIDSEHLLEIPAHHTKGTLLTPHSIFFDVSDDGRIQVVANSNGARASEVFTFGYDGSRFPLERYEIIFGGIRCNTEVIASHHVLSPVKHPIFLRGFTWQKFKENYEPAMDVERRLQKQMDRDLEKQYEELLALYRKGDVASLTKAVSRYIVATDSKNRKCEPKTYMSRYLFLDSPTKTEVSNNIAFFLEQTGFFEEAVYLLEKITDRYPDRTVAYINLADAQWGLGLYEEARHSYESYISRMKAGNMANRIPDRAWKRARQ